MGKSEVEVIVFDGIKRFNEKHIETQFKHSNLAAVTLQYFSELRKQKQESQDCGNYQPCRRFLEDFAIQIIMDCRATPAVRFRAKLGFNQQDPIMTQGQSVLSKIVAVFAAEEIILQHNVLSFQVDAYSPKQKLAIEGDKQGHSDGDIDYEIERQKAVEKEFGCKFISYQF